jgi:hypothetical protein
VKTGPILFSALSYNPVLSAHQQGSKPIFTISLYLPRIFHRGSVHSRATPHSHQASAGSILTSTWEMVTVDLRWRLRLIARIRWPACAVNVFLTKTTLFLSLPWHRLPLDSLQEKTDFSIKINEIPTLLFPCFRVLFYLITHEHRRINSAIGYLPWERHLEQWCGVASTKSFNGARYCPPRNGSVCMLGGIIQVELEAHAAVSTADRSGRMILSALEPAGVVSVSLLPSVTGVDGR